MNGDVAGVHRRAAHAHSGRMREARKPLARTYAQSHTALLADVIAEEMIGWRDSFLFA